MPALLKNIADDIVTSKILLQLNENTDNIINKLKIVLRYCYCYESCYEDIFAYNGHKFDIRIVASGISRNFGPLAIYRLWPPLYYNSK